MKDIAVVDVPVEKQCGVSGNCVLEDSYSRCIKFFDRLFVTAASNIRFADKTVPCVIWE